MGDHQEEFDSFVQRVQRLKDDNDLDSAAQLLTRAISEGAFKKPRLYGLLAGVYSKMSRVDAALEVLQTGLDEYPNADLLRHQLASQQCSLGRFNEALQVIGGIPQKRITDPMRVTIARIYLGLNDLDKAYQTCLQLPSPWNNEVSQLLGSLAVRKLANGDDGAIDEIAGNVATPHLFWDGVGKRIAERTANLWMENEVEKSLRLIEFKYGHPQLFAFDPDEFLGHVEIIIGSGNHARAKELLKRHAAFDSERHRQRHDWLLFLCDASEVPDSWGGTETLRPDEVFFDGSLLHYRQRSNRCLVLFSGLILSNTSLILSEIMPLLCERRIGALVVIDKKRYMSMAGFGPFFPDRQASRTALENMLKNLGYSEVAMTGNSGAGYSALIYGTEMRASGILGLNAITKIPEVAELTSPFARKHIGKLRSRIDINPTDSYTNVENTPDTKVFLRYSAASPEDAEITMHLKPLQNVVLLPHPHDQHSLFDGALGVGELQRWFSEFFDAIGWR